MMEHIDKDKLNATFKSQDTEEWLDIHFTRPIGYLWALFFKFFHIHPNVVTIFSIIIGVAAGVMFYYTDFVHNLIGVLLLVWANLYDSADGQLARMTGQKTLWGRILDGFAGDVWFFSIYLAIVLRVWNDNIPFLHFNWGIFILAIALFSGLVCHSKQCQLADYYRNIHLFFLKGKEGSELDTSRKQREILSDTPLKGNFWKCVFLYFYGKYTHSQEVQTPYFQDLMNVINKDFDGKAPEKFRLDFRKESLPLMKYANIVTFNCRAITLYVCCLVNIPWLYFFIEIIVFSAIAYYMRERHERMCKHFALLLKGGYYADSEVIVESN